MVKHKVRYLAIAIAKENNWRWNLLNEKSILRFGPHSQRLLTCGLAEKLPVLQRDFERTAPSHYRANLEKLIDYILKGASPDAVHELQLEKVKAGGWIVGKRAGFSENIGKAAQA